MTIETESVDFIDDLARPADSALSPEWRAYAGRLEQVIRLKEAELAEAHVKPLSKKLRGIL